MIIPPIVLPFLATPPAGATFGTMISKDIELHNPMYLFGLNAIGENRSNTTKIDHVYIKIKVKIPLAATVEVSAWTAGWNISSNSGSYSLGFSLDAGNSFQFAPTLISKFSLEIVFNNSVALNNGQFSINLFFANEPAAL